MPEKSSKRRLRRHSPEEGRDENDATTQRYTESSNLAKRDFEEITNKIESKISKRLQNISIGQLETIMLIESSSSKVDSLTNSNSGTCSSNRGITPSGSSGETPMKWMKYMKHLNTLVTTCDVIMHDIKNFIFVKLRDLIA